MKLKFFSATAPMMLAVAVGVATIPAPSQAAGPGVGEDKPSQISSYYVVPNGKEDEWLALYKKWHAPFMQDLVREGVVLNAKFYTAASHAPHSWTFKAVFTVPPAGKGPKPSVSTFARLRKLFPDVDAYVAGEKARWTLTTDHWDETAAEVDLTQDEPSVYYPR